MNPLYNYKPFIYRERNDIDELLSEHPIWDEIYNVFLKVKDNVYNLKVPTLQMFNEVYFQAIKISLDKHPEENIRYNYLNVAYNNLGWRYASDLCFSIVYTVFKLMKNPAPNTLHFCSVLEKYFEDKNTNFPKYINEFLKIINSGVEYDFELKRQLEIPEQIENKDYEWWQDVTVDFQQKKIREIVSFWEDKKDKLEIIGIIEKAFDEAEEHMEDVELPF